MSGPHPWLLNTMLAAETESVSDALFRADLEVLEKAILSHYEALPMSRRDGERLERMSDELRRRAWQAQREPDVS